MKIGQRVKIKPIEALGRIVAIIQCEYGTKIEVRYFWDGIPHQETFFEDELEEQ